MCIALIQGMSSIYVCSMENPAKRRMLLHGNLTNARAIVLNPRDGYMYWSVWRFTTVMGRETTSEGPDVQSLIERSWMDGSHREPFVTKDLQWPNGLTIDFKEGHLYWCDGYHSVISRVKLDGSEYKVRLVLPWLAVWLSDLLLVSPAFILHAGAERGEERREQREERRKEERREETGERNEGKERRGEERKEEREVRILEEEERGERKDGEKGSRERGGETETRKYLL